MHFLNLKTNYLDIRICFIVLLKSCSVSAIYKLLCPYVIFYTEHVVSALSLNWLIFYPQGAVLSKVCNNFK